MTSITGNESCSWDTLAAKQKEQDPLAREQESKRLQKARSLDRATIGAIYDDYHQLIYTYIYHRVGEVELSRDLTADVFRRFLQAIHNGNGPTDNLRAWLYRVAHNIVVDHYRRPGSQQEFPLHENLILSDHDPSQTAEIRLQAEKVRLALNHLTSDQQQVVILKFIEGFSNKEVAEIIGKPVGAVKSLQHRALTSLQRQLIPIDEEVSV